MSETAEAVIERPIIFSAGMVQRILQGRKSQTRRVLKTQPRLHPLTTRVDEEGFIWWSHCVGHETRGGKPCPYGKPGDRLWVRETWQAWAEFDKTTPAEMVGLSETGVYQSDGCTGINYGKSWASKVRSPLHMPRWASRLILEITGVRVERLQDISVNDACAEGAPIYDDDPHQTHAVLTWFESIWEDIHGEGAWKRNEWVWAISFRPVRA